MKLLSEEALCVSVAAILVGVLGGCEESGVAEGTAQQAAVPQQVVVQQALADRSAPIQPNRQPATRQVLPVRPPVEFEPPLIDLGFIRPGDEAEGTIAIRNVGDAPLTVTEAKASCACTTLTNLAGVVIAPGESVSMVARLDSQSTAGIRKASVTFRFAGYEQPLAVDLRGEVALPVKATPSIFNLATGDRSGHVVVESIDRRPFNILAANREPPRFVGFDPVIDEPRSSYILEWDFTELADEDLEPWWTIETDHPECPILDTWVRHLATIQRPPRAQKWRLADQRTLLGVFAPGASIEFVAKVNKIGAERIYAVRSLSSEFNAELLRFEHDGVNGVCTVRLTPAKDHRGLFHGPVEFIANQYTMKLWVTGKIE